MLNLNQAKNLLLMDLQAGLDRHNLVGHAGIGKTEIIRQVATELGWHLYEITMTSMQEGDFVMPYPKESGHFDGVQEVSFILHERIMQIFKDYKEVVEHNKTVLKEMQETDVLSLAHKIADGKINSKDFEGTKAYYGLLYLDEFNRAVPKVQSEIMNIILSKEIQGIKLPKGTRVVVATNPTGSTEGFENDGNYVTFEGDSAINDRTVRVRVTTSFDDWVEHYGLNPNPKYQGKTLIHPVIMDFLGNGNDRRLLIIDEEKDVNPTPRSWKTISDRLYAYENLGISFERNFDDTNTHYPLVAEVVKGSVGDETGRLFLNYLVQNLEFIQPTEFINAKESEIPKLRERLAKITESSTVRMKFIMESYATYLNEKENLSVQDVKRFLEDFLLYNPSGNVTNSDGSTNEKFKLSESLVNIDLQEAIINRIERYDLYPERNYKNIMDVIYEANEEDFNTYFEHSINNIQKIQTYKKEIY